MTINPLKLRSLPWHTYLKQFKHYWIALLIFLLGVLLSIGAFRFYEQQELKRTQLEFNRLAEIRIFLIKDEIKGIVEQLNNVKQFFYASTHVTNDDFNIFTSHALELFPDLLCLGWYSFNPPESMPDSDKASLKFISIEPYLSNTQYHFFSLDYLKSVEIQVRDTSIGLTEEEINKIFKPFTQADSSITRKFGGTGLGLAISKKIIDLHRGSLTVKSTKGKGSVFIIMLPKVF